MSYTFTPIPAIDTINNHTGFVIVMVIMLVIFILIWASNDDDFNMYKVFILCSVPVAIAALVSWNTGEYKEFANTKVEGKFIGFVAEGHRVSERHGKTTRMVDKHYTYVEYEVEGNRVLFHSKTGNVYPKIAVIYKN